MLAGWTALLAASTLKTTGPVYCTPGMGYCCTELPSSSLLLAKSLPVLSMPTHAGMARLSWPERWFTCPKAVTHLATNQAQQSAE